MGIRKYKPTTPGRRGSSVADFVEVTRSTPEKSLVRPLTKSGGRNSNGRITTRHIGGGHKRAYRVIDFRRHDKDGVPAKVAHIEFDPEPRPPSRAPALRDSEKRYILARPRRACRSRRPAADVEPAQQPAAAQRPGRYRHPRRRAEPGRGAKIARSAGCVVSARRQGRPLRPAPYPSGEIHNVDVPAAPPSARSATPSRSNINGARPAASAGRAAPNRRGVVIAPSTTRTVVARAGTSGGRHPSPLGSAEAAPAAPQAQRQAHRRRRRPARALIGALESLVA